ncbi:MAG: hypothetical protein HC902_03450 [Calothrix sp. SM1_5_4]|nr:hypothetical protein [Calothrix sp. SM1_5_4]
MSDTDSALLLPKKSKFGLEELRLSQDFDDGGGEKVITTISVRKPNPQEYVRVHPGSEFSLPTLLLEHKVTREHYLVASELRTALQQEVVPKTLQLAINRQGETLLWPIRLPQTDGRLDRWNQSARVAPRKPRTVWIRLVSNLRLGYYEVFAAKGELEEPVWPELNLEQVVEIAFADRYIDTMDHPVIRELEGRL